MPSDVTPAWEVISQTEDFRPGEGGAFVQGISIRFRIPTGSVGSVFIPTAKYTESEVRRQIGELAATMIAVAQLKG